MPRLSGEETPLPFCNNLLLPMRAPICGTMH
jgi:hypothetical protein